jgi:hypothetical protein
MSYAIDRDALRAFVDRQVALIEATPLPHDLGAAVAATTDMAADELRAVWLAAGLATQLGLALLDAPERFIRAAPAAAVVA